VNRQGLRLPELKSANPGTGPDFTEKTTVRGLTAMGGSHPPTPDCWRGWLFRSHPRGTGGYTATVSVKEYAEAKEQFPNLEDLPVDDTPGGYKWYRRRDMVRGLWKVAGQEFQLGDAAMAKLTQM
jgi:hypothetical protein